MLKKIREWFGRDAAPNKWAALANQLGATDPARIAVVTLRALDVARKFPQNPPKATLRLKRGEQHACATCAGALTEVILTTGGALGDPSVWAEYPLALDGWQCASCKAVVFPAALTPEQITQVLDESVFAAQAGLFDEAEFGFRRAVSSWPGYMPAHLNFGSMCLDRVRAEQRGDRRPNVVASYAREAELQFRAALAGEPTAPPEAAFMLGKLLWRQGNRTEGRQWLETVLTNSSAGAALRTEAQTLLAEERLS